MEKKKRSYLDLLMNDPTSVVNGGTNLRGLSDYELRQFRNLLTPDEKRKMAEESRNWMKKHPDLVRKYARKYGRRVDELI